MAKNKGHIKVAHKLQVQEKERERERGRKFVIREPEQQLQLHETFETFLGWGGEGRGPIDWG